LTPRVTRELRIFAPAREIEIFSGYGRNGWSCCDLEQELSEATMQPLARSEASTSGKSTIREALAEKTYIITRGRADD
jgi:hypothetical protein